MNQFDPHSTTIPDALRELVGEIQPDLKANFSG